ncbi:hypothetical protein LSTR_LSTR013759 [Laodelphax striatellus]|uniref:ATP-dependent DNA helicase PIF1 n=1 Tax=Laodelphax striatellus TaxID=195883 RepID=A0A482WL56_LAOST|nr:hypothetical protein LSTR_LSTR013759 [Laodelphax striatellus]
MTTAVPSSSELTCDATINWVNNQNVVTKTVKCKSAVFELVRNEFRDLFFKATTKGLKLKLIVNNLTIHKNFVSEGKATINFQESKTIIYLSNAPVSNLMLFLKTLFVKMTSKKSSPKVPLKERLMSDKPNMLTDISPVNGKDMNRLKQALPNKATDTKKRKLPTENDQDTKKKCVASLMSQHTLTSEQKKVLDAVKEGHNIFFTGSAGTGKSYLLKVIINSIPPDVTFATASTGAAACLIGGITLHSFAGIGTGEASFQKCLELASRPHVLQNWKRCKYLIIDEVSMVKGNYFEKLEKVARALKNPDKPFGGVQLILSGDFLQLPPVSKDDANNRFCFQMETWDLCKLTCFQLKQVHRQNDPEFISILNSIRTGRITNDIADRLNLTRSQSIGGNGIQATRLCCYTNEANTINKTNLENLAGEAKDFEASDSDKGNSKILDEYTPVEKTISLKVGAQVMLVKNINVSKGLVNGARGVVTKFSSGLPVVKFLSMEYTVKQEKWIVRAAGGLMLTRIQLPLKLAWAFSIHKSQGLTLDCVEMNLSQVFEAGQAYVALSRAKSLDCLRVIDFDMRKIWANPDVLKFYKRLDQRCRDLESISEFIPLGRKK